MYREIRITEIRPNPANPRKNFEGRKFDELVNSIRKVGVIEPVLVRSVNGDTDFCSSCEYHRAMSNKKKGVRIPGAFGKCIRPEGLCDKAGSHPASYELIAGERRWRACYVVANENGGPDTYTIPAIVKDVDEDTAFELMTIENLQREDLTEFEEANGFKSWVDRKGKESVDELAERCGLSPRYIRRRLAVLELPGEVLSSWNEGNLKYGHLEQLLRVRKNPDLFNELLDETDDFGLSVKEMRERIDSYRRPLDKAIFDINEAGCNGCSSNSRTQMQIFGLGDDKEARCMDPECYERRVAEYLSANFAETIGKKYKTNGYLFSDNIEWQNVNFISGKIKKGCKDCQNLVTIFDAEGCVTNKQVCIGPKDCFRKLYLNTAATGESKNTGKDDDKPRVQWHGTYFREQFYQESLPGRFDSLAPDHENIRRLVLFAFIWCMDFLHGWFAKRHGLKVDDDNSYFSLEDEALFKAISAVPDENIPGEIKAAAIEASMNERFGVIPRHLVSQLAGVDLAGEWIITGEYLNKKTKAEILQLGEAELDARTAIFQTDEAKAFLLETLGVKNGSFDKLKKPDLIRVFLESGVSLEGRVPDEILRADEINPSGYLG